MLKKLIARLKENLLLKLVSILIAIVIWYVVVNYNDPVETASYTVRIAVENDSYIANGKQIYRIDDAYKTVTVFLKGNRSDLRDVVEDDIRVTADLTQIVDLELDPVMVPLSASCPGFSPANITLSRQTIPLTIETIDSKTFPVTVDTGDSAPGKDYEIGSMTPDPEQIVINGPQSIISQIDSVVAQIDVTGMTRDGDKEASLRLVDKNSTDISAETIEDDLSFEGGIPDISVHVDLWKKRSDVSIRVRYTGTPAEGYHVSGTITTPETITIVGDDAALSELAMQGNAVTVPAEMISVDNAIADVTADIPLADILPDNIRAARNTVEVVTVYVTILPDESREMILDVEDIEVLNLDPNLILSYDQAEFTVRIQGEGSVVEALKVSDIGASIDLKGQSGDELTLPVDISLPDGARLMEEVTLTVHLKQKATPTPTASPTAQASN